MEVPSDKRTLASAQFDLRRLAVPHSRICVCANGIVAQNTSFRRGKPQSKVYGGTFGSRMNEGDTRPRRAYGPRECRLKRGEDDEGGEEGGEVGKVNECR